MRFLILSAVALSLSACAAPGGRPATTDTAQPTTPKVTAAQLLGQDDGWLRQHLGAPDFARTDRTANLWQYKNSHCVLNVFLYAEGEAAPSQPGLHVLHFDARDANGANTDREACLAALQN